MSIPDSGKAPRCAHGRAEQRIRGGIVHEAFLLVIPGEFSAEFHGDFRHHAEIGRLHACLDRGKLPMVMVVALARRKAIVNNQ